MARDEVILQQRLEILLARRAEQECIHFNRQFCERLVCGRKESTADLGVGCVELFDQTRLDEGQVQSAEEGRDEFDGGFGGKSWDEEFVDCVDYAVCGVLYTPLVFDQFLRC